MTAISRILPRRLRIFLIVAAVLAVLGFYAGPLFSPARAAVDGETQYVLNTFSFLIWGVLVMWMCAGFTMLEAGSVRTKNASMICMKNIGLYSIAGLAFFVIGYNLMYVDVATGGVIGAFRFLYGPGEAERALVGGDAGAVGAVVEAGYSTMSDWFFQMVFVATTASIVSGAIAERVKMWSFFLFTLLLTAFIYPIVARGHGAAAGWRTWASRTSQAPPSSTAWAAGRRWRAS